MQVKRGTLIEDSAPQWRGYAQQATIGLALASLFGAAAGARYGLASLLLHAAGTPLPFLAITTVLVPSLFVAFAYADLFLSPQDIARICATALYRAGYLLAGLAPATLMLSVSAESNSSIALIAAVGLAGGGAAMLGQLIRGVNQTASSTESTPKQHLLLTLFGLIATVASIRIWWLVMPLFRGPA